MGFSVSHELFVLLYSSLAGVLIALIFDIFRIIRKKVSTGMFLSAAQDILFWIVATLIMFFVIYFANKGTLRLYQFVGAFSGAFLYFLLLSRWITLFLCRFIDIFCKILEFFLKILLTPLKITYKLLCVSLSFSVLPIVKLLKKIIKKLIYKLRKNFRAFKFLKNKK